MTIKELYAIADRDGIYVEHQLIGITPALSVKIGADCAICLDPSLAKTEAEYKEVLAHELGHCETLAFYNQYSPLETKARQEHKALVWEIKKLLPEEEIKKAARTMQRWEIAEYFGVPEWLVVKAMEYYKK